MIVGLVVVPGLAILAVAYWRFAAAAYEMRRRGQCSTCGGSGYTFLPERDLCFTCEGAGSDVPPRGRHAADAKWKRPA